MRHSNTSKFPDFLGETGKLPHRVCGTTIWFDGFGGKGRTRERDSEVKPREEGKFSADFLAGFPCEVQIWITIRKVSISELDVTFDLVLLNILKIFVHNLTFYGYIMTF